jgi:uncharacterized protein
MKYLLLFAVVLGVLWWARSRSPRAKPPPSAPRPSVSEPQAMVACAECGLNLPRSEAVVGSNGLYCSAAHLKAHGDGA